MIFYIIYERDIMKNIFMATLLLTVAFSACNNENEEAESEELVNPTPLTGVENVNGNIPDTTNAIRLGDTTVGDPRPRQ
jgi:hypothetical protein